MGILIEGVWQPAGDYARTPDGRFVRRDTQFRNWITPGGGPGPTGEGGFAAAPGRYHLYVSYACPWAHRTLIYRKLKRLEDAISVSVVGHHLGEHGWEFTGREGSTPDEVNGAQYLHEVYVKARPDYSGRVSVPVLWDKERRTIVSNESSEIIWMLDTAFDAFTPVRLDSRPPTLAAEIDVLNERIYRTVNNGVYRCGFATSQQAYEEAFGELFATLDFLDTRLAGSRYLVADHPTEADWRLFPTLVRFDPVYVGHFKCNRQRIADYANLWPYTRDLYQVPGVAETVDVLHIKRHYYGSHRTLNPTGIVPVGPAVDFALPQDRAALRRTRATAGGR